MKTTEWIEERIYEMLFRTLILGLPPSSWLLEKKEWFQEKMDELLVRAFFLKPLIRERLRNFSFFK
jgi:hypothetical protein